jgi:hypothetical protein
MFVYSGGVATPFVTASGSGPFGGVDYPQINSAGDVAFRGYVFQPVEGFGIFTGPDPVADKVIQTGDTLFGSTVTSIYLSAGRQLNDRGDVVFSYGLANGVIGIAVARVILPGDYNENGTVDAADFTLWRDHLGQTFTLTNENPLAATPGVVDDEDYSFWKSYFGQTAAGFAAGAGRSTAAPETASWALFSLAMMLLGLRKSR